MNCMYIADRLKSLRHYRKLSQRDLGKRTGMLRCYISRVENGHTVPSLETLERFSQALEIPLYQVFYSEEEALNGKVPIAVRREDWASHGKGSRVLAKMRRALGHMSEKDRRIFLTLAAQLNKEHGSRKS
jgi:transcriptional regulator with XRE-family HTH domain